MWTSSVPCELSTAPFLHVYIGVTQTTTLRICGCHRRSKSFDIDGDGTRHTVCNTCAASSSPVFRLFFGVGSIDPQEFRDGLRGLNIGISTSQVESLLSLVDSDGDGVVDCASDTFANLFLFELRHRLTICEVQSDYEFAEQVGGIRRAEAASHSLAHKVWD